MLIKHLIRRHFAFHAPEGGGEGSGGGGTPPPPAGGAPGAGEAGAGAPNAAGEGEGSGEGAGEGGEGEGGEPTVMLGDEPIGSAEPAAPWVKELRRKFREQAQRLAQYERTGTAPPPAALPPDPGAKPMMRDFDFDGDKYTAALDTWHEARNKRARAEADAAAATTAEQAAWNSRVEAYRQDAKALGFADFEDCEAAALAELTPVQQGIIVQGAEKHALIMYALGRNTQLARDLGKITDPVKFAFAIADLQRKLTVSKRKPTTRPEPAPPASSLSASSALAGEDKQRDALREKAAKTGDMTELMQYNRTQREKARRAA